jgi:hypothetical protein
MAEIFRQALPLALKSNNYRCNVKANRAWRKQHKELKRKGGRGLNPVGV